MSDIANINYSLSTTGCTVLGPLLFIIHINGFLDQCIQGKLVYFADNTVRLVKNQNLNDLYKWQRIVLLHLKIGWTNVHKQLTWKKLNIFT